MLDQHATLELSRSRLGHNLALLRARMSPSAQLCPVIKANAYGHGVGPMASMLQESGIGWVAVYTIGEALQLADYTLKILVLAPLVVTKASGVLAHRIPDWAGMQWRFNITDAVSAANLSQRIAATGRTPRWPIHIQVDTGLTRAGVAPSDVGALAEAIATLPGLRLEGLFAHFSHADVPGHPTVQRQLQTLLEVANGLRKRHPGLLVHTHNSAATFHLDPRQMAGLDMLRVGIALYGLQPSTANRIEGLQPIARLTAPILAIHDCPAGTGAGYGHTFITNRPSRLAIVPVGYADGYPRCLSNKGVVQAGGQDLPVVGRVSMDQIIIDVTDLQGVAVGNTVTVISDDPVKPNGFDALADATGTIGYEIATRIGPRVERRIVD